MRNAVLGMLGAAVLAGGCSRNPQTYVVSGTVSYRGKPLGNAGVTFVPHYGRPAMAITDAHGRFRLRTYDLADGAVLGEHAVCVMKSETPAPDAAHPYPCGRLLVPARYGNPLKTPLRATVTAGGPNDFQLNLTD
jgi:hypothetical protein